MDKNIKRFHSPEFKTNVVLELLKHEQSLAQICTKFSIHPTQAGRWREHVLKAVKESFNGKSVSNQIQQKDQLISELYRQIGQLKVELDWLKKKLGYTTN